MTTESETRTTHGEIPKIAWAGAAVGWIVAAYLWFIDAGGFEAMFYEAVKFGVPFTVLGLFIAMAVRAGDPLD